MKKFTLVQACRVAVLLLLAVACSGQATQPVAPTSTPQPEPSETPLPTEMPTETSTVQPTPTEELSILYQDDFSDVNSGWERYSAFDGVLDYEDGGYRLQVSVPNNLFWVNYGLGASDIIIEADALKGAGPDANHFGLMCRYNNTSFSFYVFLINAEGEFGIGKWEGGALQLISADAFEFSEAINQGEQSNHLRAACIGDTLTFSVNGQLLAEVQDGTLQGGDIGMAMSNGEEAGTDALFDNLVVYAP
jgi:hypothetical protein